MFADEMMFVGQNLMSCFWMHPEPVYTSSNDGNSSPEELSQTESHHNESSIIRKHRWTEIEDRQLEDAVKTYGAKNWVFIAKNVPTRSAKQCRERWIVHHDKNFARTLWTKEEDDTLVELQRKIGNKFSIIAKSIKNRSSIDVKNRWKFLKNHNLIKRPDGDAHFENASNEEIFQNFDDSPEF